MKRPAFWMLAAALILSSLQAAGEYRQIGVARVDVTPEFPIRLTGYVVRKQQAGSAAQRLWAKALAIGSDADGPAIIITVDNCGVCANVVDEVAARLKTKAGIARERFAVCSSHTHAGPQTIGFAPNIFAMILPPDQQAAIERYTKTLTDKLEQVALAALKDRQPGKLTWGQGTVGFAKNRRTEGGPVDHSFSLLQVTGEDGKTRAMLGNYACHCTTIGGEFVQACGDWAGFAQDYLERDNPGAIALIAVGCGADSNPSPRGGKDFGLALSQQHGEAIATETKRVLSGAMKPLDKPLTCRFKRIELPFQKHFTRAEWEERAKQPDIVGFHARRYLERLDRGEPLPTHLAYPIESWAFGEDMEMLFLGGEVVVDYALRLKKDYDASRLWINAYANDVPCYIPSKRILAEGGYEAESSLWYYDRPQKLSPEIEDLIIKTVREITPKAFLSEEKKAEFPPAKSPKESLEAIKVRDNLKVELVAAEPLIADPVAIDFGADGRLWVVEMNDFPSGMNGNWKPGGQVRLLEDVNGDGIYDRGTTFMTDLPFPTGIMAWHKGALICAAPYIIYAEDTDGDGKADLIKELYSGFATHNYQARVNGLSLGLDNWVYGASGLFGGKIIGTVNGKIVDVSGRDFRFKPETGEFEPAAGISQQGRIRDDFGNWFGNDNSTLLWHFPLPEHYVRRNVSYTPPSSRTYPPDDPDPNQLYPASRTLRRFNDPGSANRVTSACGPGIYRDDLLGRDYTGSAFVCEPVHNLVRRLVLEPDGNTFTAHKARGERESEFLASTDNWFRPVQVVTGRDGALWVVDMYRFVVEHPRWITPNRLAELDLRAGDDKGRIYRIFAKDHKPRPIRNLAAMPVRDLAAAMESPNGPERDAIQQEIVRRADRSAKRSLQLLARSSPHPAVRWQSLSTLDGLNALSPGLVKEALKDASPEVIVHAIRLAEPQLRTASGSKVLLPLLRPLAHHPDPRVRFQLALSLGESSATEAGLILREIALHAADDPWLQPAILTSCQTHAGTLIEPFAETLLGNDALDSEAHAYARNWLAPLIATLSDEHQTAPLGKLASMLTPAMEAHPDAPRLAIMEKLLVAFAANESRQNPPSGEIDILSKRVRLVARRLVLESEQNNEARSIAARLLAQGPLDEDTAQIFTSLLGGANPLPVQQAAIAAMGGMQDFLVAQTLMKDWKQHSPALRSRIIATLLSREDWTRALLTKMEKNEVAVADIPMAQRATLAKHFRDDIRRRAERVLQQSASSDRSQVVSNYRIATSLNGNGNRGATLFANVCATCHAFRGLGHAVGPDLAALTDKSPSFLLTSILDPNAAVDERFRNYSVETRDGRSLSGIISGETATGLTLVKADGTKDELLRSQITEIRASNLSLMPEGFEAQLKPQDIADLIAFLRSEGAVSPK